MARKTIWNKAGESYTGEPVDCSELLRSGNWSETPPDAEKSAEVAGIDYTAMSKPELKAALDKNGIAYETSATKSEMLSLLVGE